MKKLLTLVIGTTALTATAVSPVIVNSNLKNTTTNTKTIKEAQLHGEITISNSKHKTKQGLVIPGIKDYKEEFTRSINAIRAQLIKENAINITVSNIETKFKNVPYPGKIELPTETFSKLLTAKTVEITATEVSIGIIGPNLHGYQIMYSAIIDGKEVKNININGYNTFFNDIQVGSLYSITFDINYQKQ